MKRTKLKIKQKKLSYFAFRHVFPISILVILLLGLLVYKIQTGLGKITNVATTKSAQQLGFNADYSVRLLNTNINFKFLPNATVKTHKQVAQESCDWYQKQYEDNVAKGKSGGWMSTQYDVAEACAHSKRKEVECENFDTAKISWKDEKGLDHDFMMKYYSTTCSKLRKSSINASYAMPISEDTVKTINPEGKVLSVQQNDIGEIITYEQAMTSCTNSCSETNPDIYRIIVLKSEKHKNMIIQILPFQEDEWATALAETINL